MKRYQLCFISLLLLLFAGCSEEETQQMQKEDYRIDIQNVEFEPDFKRFYTDVVLDSELSALMLQEDSTIQLKVSEYVGNEMNHRTQPKLVDVVNVVSEELSNLSLKVFALVDLTVDSVQVLEQQKVIRGLKKLLTINNFYVAFIGEHGVSETMMASDYVLDNYFKPVHGEKYLYRGVYEKFKEYTILRDSLQDSTQCMMIVMSDGKVYDDQKLPIDPDHFAVEQKILELSASPSAPVVYYIPVNWVSEVAVADNPASNFFQLLCKKTHGGYFFNYDQRQLLSGILEKMKRRVVDFRLTFENPDLKVYQGTCHNLCLECMQGDSLLASDVIDYYVGSIYNPVIINGPTTLQVVMQGVLLGFLILIVIYLIFQFIIPFFHYLYFRKKYVTTYKGENMSYNGHVVGNTCYYCKAPLVEGDSIVVKCKHVMHESCWNENGYKCPEYGRNCKHGSHYYNFHQLFDPHNAPYFMSWILLGTLAGLIAWFTFILFASSGHNSILEDIVPFIFGVDAQSPEAVDLVNDYGSHLFHLPFYGLNMGFFLTFGLSLLVGHGRWWGKRILMVITKAFLGGAVGFLAFFLGSLVSIILNFKDNSFLIDWIPWMLSGLGITYIISFATDVKLKRAMIGAVVSIIFGLGSMYFWSFSVESQIDTREFILLSYLIYAIGLSFSIATTYPKSERYFLRVEGPIKQMDIALYKWINSSFLHKRIVIGKSVNCELQMSWDIEGDVAPQQAEVRMINGNLYLFPLEEGVEMDGKPLPVAERVRLYHGSKFVIGKTLFTYLEKDI